MTLVRCEVVLMKKILHILNLLGISFIAGAVVGGFAVLNINIKSNGILDKIKEDFDYER